MPVRFLSEEAQRRYARYDGEPSAEDPAHYFCLSDVDLELIRRRRWDNVRLEFALRLGTVRYLSTFINRPVNVPPGVISVLADQLRRLDRLFTAKIAVNVALAANTPYYHRRRCGDYDLCSSEARLANV